MLSVVSLRLPRLFHPCVLREQKVMQDDFYLVDRILKNKDFADYHPAMQYHGDRVARIHPGGPTSLSVSNSEYPSVPQY